MHKWFMRAARKAECGNTDAGANWLPLTDGQAALATGSLALDPQRPDTVYVGTGEANFNADSYFGSGILKSLDGGSSG